nr:MAG TPA: hypothetical protein [Caudoviricetes sp.]
MLFNICTTISTNYISIINRHPFIIRIYIVPEN